MSAPKIVFRPKSKEASEVVFVLKRKSDADDVPSVFEISTLREGRQEVGRLRAKAIPAKYQRVERAQDAKGDVFAFVSEIRSAPSTPLPRSRSADKPKHEQEEKIKHDAFDAAADELLILALEMKGLMKGFLPERDSGKLEEKLNEYLGLLKRMEEMTKDPCLTEKEQLNVSTEVWDAIDAGVHPDVHVMERSEEILNRAERNVKTAQIVEHFLEIGERLRRKT